MHAPFASGKLCGTAFASPFLSDRTRHNTSSAASPLAGKTALVTGSTSGIGLGLPTPPAKAGANLVLNGFGDAAVIQSAIAQIEQHGVRAVHHGADMSKSAEIEAMMAFAIEQFGAVDVLVNNAGIQHVASIDTFPVEKWDAIIAINLTSAFHTMRVALPKMRDNGWGRVINIASAHGLVGSAGERGYVGGQDGDVRVGERT